MSFPKHVFKAYDIRGLVDGEITPSLAEAVGRAFVSFLVNRGANLGGKFLVVGRDMRGSGEKLQTAVIKGITDSGVNVVDIGLVSTPLFNFACANYKENMGGIMVTASHNPAVYNGFKITLHDGSPVGQGSGMEEIRELAEKNELVEAKEKGQISKKEILPDYLAAIFNLADIKSIKPLKIVIDAGNGMAKATIPHTLEKLGIKAEYLYLEPDGNFPNHEANPLKTETLKDLQAKVLETKADFGFALDGDADRVGLVDETGKVVDASFVGALVGLEVLKRHKKGLMLYDLRSSFIVPEVWRSAGAETEMCPVGHAHIKKTMKNKGAIFASELSQHLYFHDLYDLESADLSLLYILQILSRADKKLSEILKTFQKYWHSGEINFETDNKKEIMEKIENKFKTEAEEISHLDGLWLKFDWGFASIRESNTEPILRLNVEAKTKEMMKRQVERFTKMIKE